MKKMWIIVIAVVFILSLFIMKSYYEGEARNIIKLEVGNWKLRLIVERMELQYKIAVYEKKLNVRMSKLVKPERENISDPNE